MDTNERSQREGVIYLITKNTDFAGAKGALEYTRMRKQDYTSGLLKHMGIYSNEYDAILRKRDGSRYLTLPVDEMKSYIRDIRTMENPETDNFTTLTMEVTVRATAIEEAKKTFGLIFKKPPQLKNFGKYEEITTFDINGVQCSKMEFDVTQPEMHELQKLRDRLRDEKIEENLACKERLNEYQGVRINGLNYNALLEWTLPSLAQLNKARRTQDKDFAEAGRTTLDEEQRTFLLQAAEDALELRKTQGDDAACDKLENAFFKVLASKQSKGFFKS